MAGKDTDFFIGKGELNGALDGDTVRVESRGYRSREGLPQGYVTEVVKESQKGGIYRSFTASSGKALDC